MGVTLDSLGFDSELQALYMAVSSGKTGQKCKHSHDSSPAAENNHVSVHHQHITDVPTGYCLTDIELNTRVEGIIPNLYVWVTQEKMFRRMSSLLFSIE